MSLDIEAMRRAHQYRQFNRADFLALIEEVERLRERYAISLREQGYRIVKLEHVRPSVDDYVFPASDGLHIIVDELGPQAAVLRSSPASTPTREGVVEK